MLFDVCVIGAGINGSSAAYSLAKQQKKVLLLEQFPLPHTRGSSHGQSRITRCLYKEYIYAKMSSDSFPLWRQLEKEVGETLLIQNGMLQIYSPNSSSKVNESCEALAKVNSEFVLFKSGKEINAKFPLFNVPEDSLGIFEPKGGMLLASKCLAAFQKMFKENGGLIKDGEKVEKIIPGDIIQIKTNKSCYNSKSIIIAAGAFTGYLTKQLGLNLPLQPIRTHACYWKLLDPNQGIAESGFPSFISSLNGFGEVYGLASYEYPGLIKICNHDGPSVDIDNPDAPPMLDFQKKLIQKHMVNIECTPTIVENCLYTNTPDKNFIIDIHPKFKNIIIAAGFSGTGFKMSPVTGKILADLSSFKKPLLDISMFSMERFPNSLLSKSNL